MRWTVADPRSDDATRSLILEDMAMNPIIAGSILGTLLAVTKKCPHCRRSGVYALKRPGQFYTCKHCGHRFQEKKK
jgi:hypothetical protein